jgi:AcrR family transcriptional regulator
MPLTGNNTVKKSKIKSLPPGRIKITQALKLLLEKKEFSAVTTAEIAKQALEQYQVQVENDLKGIKGALNKLRKLIWSHINVYATNRVFAKILLLEVRNHPDYYKSETYDLVKIYSDTVLRIIEEGVRNREIREDLEPKLIRLGIIGSIEQVCLSGVVFDREISPDDITENLCEFIFKGIERVQG